MNRLALQLLFSLFALSYSVVVSLKNCGGIYHESQGEINFTRNVETDAQLPDCEWSISVANNMSVLLTIVDIDIRYLDKFEVYDGLNDQAPSLTQRHDSYLSLTASALARRKNLLSSQNSMFVKFKANDDYIYLYSKRNYTINMRYKTVPFGCGGTINKTQGVIYSPGYPDGYYNNIECKWTIAVPENNSIIFTFDEFETEESHDYLKFDKYDLVKYSGRDKPPNFISNSNIRDIYFETDESNTGRGFKITFRALPLETNKTFLIFASDAIVRANSSQTDTIAVTGHKISKLMDFDLRKETVVWFEPDSHQIYIKFSNMTYKSVPMIGRPNSLALDYIHDLIYWIDAQTRTINVISINDQKNNFYSLSRLSDENPRDLVINFETSQLVWCDIGFEPKIKTSNMDGSDAKVLYADSRQVMYLTVDYQKKRYLFVDSNDHSLYSIDFYGKNERYFIKSTLILDAINSMLVVNNDLYLSNELMVYRIPNLDLQLTKSQVIYKVHYLPSVELNDVKYSYIMTNVRDIDRNRINGFRILDQSLQPMVADKCLDSDCAHICLPSAKSYRCLTPDQLINDSTPLPFNGIDYLRSDSYSDGSQDILSVFNTVFISLLVLTVVLMSLIIFKLRRDVIRIRDNLQFSSGTPRLAINETVEDTDVEAIGGGKSYQNLLKMDEK